MENYLHTHFGFLLFLKYNITVMSEYMYMCVCGEFQMGFDFLMGFLSSLTHSLTQWVCIEFLDWASLKLFHTCPKPQVVTWKQMTSKSYNTRGSLSKVLKRGTSIRISEEGYRNCNKINQGKLCCQTILLYGCLSISHCPCKQVYPGFYRY